MSMNLDIDRQELIFQVDVKPNTWLAIGLADDLVNADVIQWLAGPSGFETDDRPTNI